ncbi:hypothetical protein [Burkholderia phage CSP3]|nr:hypothetical protein [Burkholderia phage CSP3]
MDHFIGVKRVNAKPMTRGEYNAFRGWELPADENGADEGYLVEYVDGGKANTAEYAGYVSWSPRDVFERAYRRLPALDHLAPHQQRVVIEKDDLDERTEKLERFIPSQKFHELPTEERDRLRRQYHLMVALSAVLGERIAAF